MATLKETQDEINVKGGRSLQINIVFQSLLNDMTKMATLGTITISVLPFILVALDRSVKPVFSLFDLIANFGQVGHFEWRPILIYQIFERNAMKTQLTIVQIKTILRKIISLLDEIKIAILHSSGCTG